VPVYDRRYRGYAGPRLAPRALYWTLARYGFREIFGSRLLLVLFVVACLPVVVYATLIYVANNLELLKLLNVQSSQLQDSLSGTIFFWFVVGQGNLAFLFASLAGPSLVGPDLAHGAMPLFLSRPLGRRDYVFGKLTILVTLLSAITWIPGLLLVGLQSALGGWGWLVTHPRIPLGVFVGSLVWILVLSLLALAISAWIRWRPLAMGALFILVVVGSAFGAVVNATLETSWGKLLMFGEQIKTIWIDLFAVEHIFGWRRETDDLPVAACWLALTAVAALATTLLVRKIRAHEVVR